MGEYITTSRKTLHSGKVLDLHVDKVLTPEGKIITREIAEHSGGVVILGVVEGKVLLVRQYRHPAGKEILELPAGKLERNENPADCAIRELEEETGYRAGSVREIGRFWASPGYCTEIFYLYLAQSLEKTAQNLDQDEVLSVEQMELSEAVDACTDGRIVDSKTVLALLLYDRQG